MNNIAHQKKWTPEDLEILLDRWGVVSIPAIAKQLGRTNQAIKLKASRLGLGAVLMGGEYVTFNQLTLAVTGAQKGDGYKVTSWIKNRQFPVKTKKVENSSFRIVYLTDFWKWADRNRSFLDFSKIEPLILGEEPEWVAEQRRKDFLAISLQNKMPWTDYEDQRLAHLLKQYRYSYSDLSTDLKRSNGAIQRRILDLGLKERPLRAVNTKWTDKEVDVLEQGILVGDSFACIAQSVGKSEKATRGKLYQMYGTENADKAREKILANKNEKEG